MIAEDQASSEPAAMVPSDMDILDAFRSGRTAPVTLRSLNDGEECFEISGRNHPDA